MGRTGSVADKTLKAVEFIQQHRTWTIADLSDHLDIHVKAVRQTYMPALSKYLAVREVRPARNAMFHRGRMPALYSIRDRI